MRLTWRRFQALKKSQPFQVVPATVIAPCILTGLFLPFLKIFKLFFEWQWNEKLIPYWKETGKYAEEKGVKIAMELHGGYSVYTPYPMIKMLEGTGCKSIGANLDPSHMWWQGIDPVKAARHLNKAGCLYHFLAKDTFVDPEYVSYYGVTDMEIFGNTYGRGWQFRT